MKTLYCLGKSEMSYISFSLLCFLLYYTLLYSTVLYTTLLYSTLLYSALLYSTLHYSNLLCSTLPNSTLFYITVLYSALRYSTLELLESGAAMVPDAATQKLEFSKTFSYQLLLSELWSSSFSENLSVVWSCMNCVWTVVDVCVGQLSVPPQVAQTVGPQRHQQHTTNTQLFHKDMHRRPQNHQLLIQRLLRPLQLQRQLLLKHKVKHNAIRNLKKWHTRMARIEWQLSVLMKVL